MNICTTAITIIATVPTAIGSGAIGPQAASTSELALESSSPVGCRWCHSIGSERYCRVTARRLCACMRYCMMPAPSRRATMPTARSSATPRNSASTATSRLLSISPFLNAGSTTCWVDQPSTHASATVRAPKSRLPIVDSVNTHGSRLIATQMTAEPLEGGGRSRRHNPTRSPNHALLDHCVVSRPPGQPDRPPQAIPDHRQGTNSLLMGPDAG